ncbi:MAG: flagellar hook basal-body protein [Oscillospiraceae bacterium]|jgi:flagellar basal body rod protein FlgG|nr:flagellar hook basal-body protein [Oscillospiraceae bacterium]
MLSGFYTAASGILTQQRNLSVVSNNMANSQTVGFKSDRLVTSTFDHTLMTRIERGTRTHIGTTSPISTVDDIVTNLESAGYKSTERPFDMAISGEGYFNIMGLERQYMTRNGNFNIDQEGYLVLEGIGRVLGENGAVNVGGSDFTVDYDGSVYDGNMNYIDRLLVTVPDEGVELQKYNNGLFSSNQVQIVGNATVFQKLLERSNTDMNEEYTRLMEAQKAFTACSNALQIMDTMNSRATAIAMVS